MDKHPINELMGTVLSKLHEMVDVSAVIGQSITTPDGITIIPVSRVSVGFGSGGSDFTTKHQQPSQSNPFGGGGGGGMKIDPLAFVVIRDGQVRVMTIEPPAATTVDRLIDGAPELIDKVTATVEKFINDRAEKKAKAAEDNAGSETVSE